MARDFDSASQQRLTASNPVSGTPCTFACWFNVEKQSADPATNSSSSLVGIGETGVTSDFLRLYLKDTNSTASAIRLAAQHFDGDTKTALTVKLGKEGTH